MWLIPEESAAYDYTIPDDDIFYIMATSGIYANQSDAFDDLTTNWIGVLVMLLGQIPLGFRTLPGTNMAHSPSSLSISWSADLSHLGSHADIDIIWGSIDTYLGHRLSFCASSKQEKATCTHRLRCHQQWRQRWK